MNHYVVVGLVELWEESLEVMEHLGKQQVLRRSINAQLAISVTGRTDRRAYGQSNDFVNISHVFFLCTPTGPSCHLSIFPQPSKFVNKITIFLHIRRYPYYIIYVFFSVPYFFKGAREMYTQKYKKVRTL